MFTIDQIKKAHSKVESGADFPAYIKEIKALGVKNYETFVSDGHTNYYGEKNYTIASPAKYDSLAIATDCNAEEFKKQLKAHQEGKTDYPTFCDSSARWGIEKWAVSLDKMSCTYYDKAGNVVLIENIPQ